jgi:hypothetical protein
MPSAGSRSFQAPTGAAGPICLAWARGRGSQVGGQRVRAILLGVRESPATAAGYADLLSWLSGFGTVALVGVEGTGSYGAGLARHLAAAGIGVVEAARAGRTGTARARPIRWMRSARRGPLCPAGRPVRRRAGTARWRRSGR